MTTWNQLSTLDPYVTASGQNLSGNSAPSLATDGINVSGSTGYYLVLAAANSNTLSGAGVLQAWVYDSTIGSWARAPELDWNVPAGASGNQYACSAMFQNIVPRKGQIAYIASGITVSGGTTCTVYVCSFPRGAAFAKV